MNDIPVNPRRPDHVLHLAIEAQACTQFRLECLHDHPPTVCDARSWFDNSDIRDLIASDFPEDCWPALVDVEWSSADEPAFHYAGRAPIKGTPPGWEHVGFLGDPKPSDTGTDTRMGFGEWTSGCYELCHGDDGSPEDYVNRRQLFASPEIEDPLGDDPKDIQVWVAAHYGCPSSGLAALCLSIEGVGRFTCDGCGATWTGDQLEPLGKTGMNLGAPSHFPLSAGSES